MNNNENQLREQIAKLIHEEWIEWAKNVDHEVSQERQKRWHSVYCNYEDLSEQMKDKDRVYVDKIINVLKKENIID
ncbi:MAG: hypothetical protein GY793_10750 [Proteobacteria bacterium]|nr:hypothetical protein [Pseudomonadota bacterium]